MPHLCLRSMSPQCLSVGRRFSSTCTTRQVGVPADPSLDTPQPAFVWSMPQILNIWLAFRVCTGRGVHWWCPSQAWYPPQCQVLQTLVRRGWISGGHWGISPLWPLLSRLELRLCWKSGMSINKSMMCCSNQTKVPQDLQPSIDITGLVLHTHLYNDTGCLLLIH